MLDISNITEGSNFVNMKNDIDNYMTPSEAAFRWGIPYETLKSKLRSDIVGEENLNEWIQKGIIKYFKKPNGVRKEWIISRQAMLMWFGEPKKSK